MKNIIAAVALLFVLPLASMEPGKTDGRHVLAESMNEEVTLTFPYHLEAPIRANSQPSLEPAAPTEQKEKMALRGHHSTHSSLPDLEFVPTAKKLLTEAVESGKKKNVSNVLAVFPLSSLDGYEFNELLTKAFESRHRSVLYALIKDEHAAPLLKTLSWPYYRAIEKPSLSLFIKLLSFGSMPPDAQRLYHSIVQLANHDQVAYHMAQLLAVCGIYPAQQFVLPIEKVAANNYDMLAFLQAPVLHMQTNPGEYKWIKSCYPHSYARLRKHYRAAFDFLKASHTQQKDNFKQMFSRLSDAANGAYAPLVPAAFATSALLNPS